jgi:hypothetical protein
MRHLAAWVGCSTLIVAAASCGGSGKLTFGTTGSTGGGGGAPSTSSGPSSSHTGSGTTTGSGGSGATTGSGGSLPDGGPCAGFKNCAEQGFNCGVASDGCGDMLDCGTCPAGQTCDAVTPNVCGCTPMTCAQQGFNCGPATNGCGAAIDCGACPGGKTCGAVDPNVCGCPNGGTTGVSGTVYAPNGTDPLSGVTVYVPGAPVMPFTPGVACESSCSASLSGSPIVSATTAANGTFTLANVPMGAGVPLVIQKGRWRRQFVLPSVAACTDTALPTAPGPTQIRMPTTKAEGDIPLMAFVTGSVDALECVLRKIGIADAEFSDPSGAGRVRLYLGSAGPGARYSASTPSETTLWGSQAAIDQYDMVYFACQGEDAEKTAAQQQILVNYANAGGRVLATHYSYVWLYDVAPFSSTATWAVDPNDDNVFANDPQTGYINQSFPRGASLAQWLEAIGASSALGQIQIGTLRHDFTSVVAPSLLWLNVDDPTLGDVPMHYTFDTPVGAAAGTQCGRVLYNDFHVEDATSGGTTFPGECTVAAMSPEEKMMEYMLFDLDDCIGP